MNWRAAVSRFDGKNIEILEQALDAELGSPGWFEELVAALADPSQSPKALSAISWLLKGMIETLESVGEERSAQLLAALPDCGEWSVRLHLLQVVPALEVDDAGRRRLEPFVRESIGSENKLVRAWGYGAFHHLAVNFVDLRDEWGTLSERARNDEAPSVRARLRNLPDGGVID